jgi:DNA-binding protein WhiA
MSFCSKIKTEISKTDSNKPEKIAELAAIIRNIGIIDENITINTENSGFARRIFTQTKDLFGISTEIETAKKLGKVGKHIYRVIIKDKQKEILKDLGIYNSKNKFIEVPKDYILDSNEEKQAYLRGIFLSSGSVNDPKTSRYHLELLVQSEKHAKFINKLINSYNLNSKVLRRNNTYMVYIKEAEKISDFLRMIKASGGVLYFEDIRIYRDHKNMTNRLNNCEQANTEKILKTALDQIEDIELIDEMMGIELLDEKVQIVCDYRRRFKESSLQELSEIISMETGEKLSKSGLNHRIRKIKEIAENLRKTGE